VHACVNDRMLGCATARYGVRRLVACWGAANPMAVAGCSTCCCAHSEGSWLSSAQLWGGVHFSLSSSVPKLCFRTFLDVAAWITTPCECPPPPPYFFPPKVRVLQLERELEQEQGRLRGLRRAHYHMNAETEVRACLCLAARPLRLLWGCARCLLYSSVRGGERRQQCSTDPLQSPRGWLCRTYQPSPARPPSQRCR